MIIILKVFRKHKFSILMIIFLLLNSSIFSLGFKLDFEMEYKFPDDIITINDFSDFNIITDNPNLDSVKSDSEISFSYTGSDTDSGEVEEDYELSFDYYVTDFAINLTLTHSTTTSIWGGFSFELNTKIPLGSRFLKYYLFGFTIDDWFPYYGGYHSMSVARNSTSLFTSITNYGDLGSFGTTTFRIVKEGINVKCTIIENSVILLSIPYTTDIVDKVNTIRLLTKTGETMPKFDITVTNIEGDITLNTPTSSSPTTPTIPTIALNSYLAVFGFISISFLLLLVRKRDKRRK